MTRPTTPSTDVAAVETPLVVETPPDPTVITARTARKRRLGNALHIAAVAGVAFVVVTAGSLLALRAHGKAPAAVATPPQAIAPALPPVAAPAPLVVPLPPPAEEVEAPPNEPPPTTGSITVQVRGHRIYIDGRMVGEGPRTDTLTCGSHDVRVGSAGVMRAIDVPCGGEIVIAKWN